MSWTERTEPDTDWDNRNAYLLDEEGGFLLWEDGTRIVISEIQFTENTDWTTRTKPTNTDWTTRTKPT